MNGIDINQTPEKDLQEKEKESIKAVTPLIKSFLDEDSKLQVLVVAFLSPISFLNFYSFD